MQKRRKSTIDAQIDDNLKRAYDEVLNEQVPDRLTQLLDQLKAQDAEKTAEKPGGDV